MIGETNKTWHVGTARLTALLFFHQVGPKITTSVLANGDHAELRSARAALWSGQRLGTQTRRCTQQERNRGRAGRKRQEQSRQKTTRDRPGKPSTARRCHEDGVQRVTPTTSGTQQVPSQENARDRSRLKVARYLSSSWVGARGCLGRSPAGFGGWSPLRGLPARESGLLPQHSHNAAGTSTRDSASGSLFCASALAESPHRGVWTRDHHCHRNPVAPFATTQAGTCPAASLHISLKAALEKEYSSLVWK